MRQAKQRWQLFVLTLARLELLPDLVGALALAHNRLDLFTKDWVFASQGVEVALGQHQQATVTQGSDGAHIVTMLQHSYLAYCLPCTQLHQAAIRQGNFQGSRSHKEHDAHATIAQMDFLIRQSQTWAQAS